ncbi:hypothetical protein Tco_0058992 [Tanacetum coccineum]
MSFSKRFDSDAVCYTKPLDSLKHWNDHFFWVDSFAYPASFPWHTDKNVSRDPFPKSTEFNADHYAILVAHPASFWKFPEPFLCLVGMSRYYTMDEDTYPMFLYDDGTGGCLSLYIIHLVKVVERERIEGERKLLESTIGRVVPLLPVASARSERELEASVDKLFDEGGSADQGDSAAVGGHDVEIKLVTVAEDVAVVTAERPRRQRKNRPAAMDASDSSHPPKKLRGDHKTSSKAATGSKSPSVLKELLASSILSDEGSDHTDSITGLNLRTIGLSKKFVISSDSSHHSSTNTIEAEVDSFIRFAAPLLVMTEAVITSHAVNVPSIPVPDTGNKTTSPVHASIFHDSDSTGTAIPDFTGPSYSTKQDLSMGSQELNTETFHQVFVLQWNVLNDSLLDDYDVSREFVDHLAPPALFSQIREMDYHYLFIEFNVGTALQACLNAEVRMQTDYCLIERSRKLKLRRNVALENKKDSLNGKVTELQSSVSVKDLELKDLNVVVFSLKSQNDGLVDQVHALDTTCSSLRDQVSGYDRLKEQIEEFQDAQMNIVNDKVAKLDADLLEMALHL